MEKNLNRLVLSVVEMEELEGYNLDTSDAGFCYVKRTDEDNQEDWTLEIYDDFYKSYDREVVCPTYTAQELLNKIPHRIECLDDELAFDFEMWPTLNKEDNKIYWILAFVPDDSCSEEVMELNYVVDEDLLIGSYEMVLWCLKHNYRK